MRTPSKPCIVKDHAAAHKGSRRIRSRATLETAIHAVANGDEKAFSAVYAATAPKLFAIILRIVRRQDLAEDVLQEVYLRTWKQAHTFDARLVSPITWMVTIARHRALDEVRRRDAELPIKNCPEALRLANEHILLASDQNDVSRDLALRRLGRDKRLIIVQAYCHGLTREEIAKRLGRPIPTVKTWLRRALAELRVYLVEQEAATLAVPTSAVSTMHAEQAHPARTHRAAS